MALRYPLSSTKCSQNGNEISKNSGLLWVKTLKTKLIDFYFEKGRSTDWLFWFLSFPIFVVVTTDHQSLFSDVLDRLEARFDFIRLSLRDQLWEARSKTDTICSNGVKQQQKQQIREKTKSKIIITIKSIFTLSKKSSSNRLVKNVGIDGSFFSSL